MDKNLSNADTSKESSEKVGDVENIESLEALTTHEEDVSKPPPIVQAAKRPRARRFFNTFLCCVGGRRPKNVDIALPLQTDLAQGQCSPKPSEKLLLPPMRHCDVNKKCLIVDLDETLVHSSFKPVKNPDFIVPVEIDGVVHQVYVLRRPHVDEFLRRIGGIYECILFTASLAKYADPVADLLDKTGVFKARLFREACVFHKGNYVKDLNRLGRDLKRVVIVDNSPASYAFHPDNAVAVQSWFDDINDTELLDVIPLLEKLAAVDNVYNVLRNSAPFVCHAPSLQSSRAAEAPPPVINITNNINISIINDNNNGNVKNSCGTPRCVTVTSLNREGAEQRSTNQPNGVVCFAAVARNRLMDFDATPIASLTPPTMRAQLRPQNQPIVGADDVIMSVERPSQGIARSTPSR